VNAHQLIGKVLLVSVAAVVATCLCLGTVAHGGVVLSGGGLVLIEQGGTFDAANLAQGATPIALDELSAYGHLTVELNDQIYGNSNSWIGNGATAPTLSYGNRAFAGINLGATPVPVSSIAFGRANIGGNVDRTLSGGNPYVLQYTQVANPGVAVTDTGNATTGWATVGTLDYQNAGGWDFTAPSLRHRYGFDAVSATGVRLLVPGTGLSGAGTAIDEIELYQTFVAPPALTLGEIGGSIVPNNMAGQSTGAAAFAKDLIAGGGYAAHQTPHLNDETYGNSNSWIGNSADTFAGVTFTGPQTIASIAWGRDNTGTLADRAAGPYTVQYTTVPNPDQNTPDADWNSFQTITYSNDPSFALRHHYHFDPIASVTGVRIAGLAAPTAIDEIELYPTFVASPTLTLAEIGGTFAPNNLAGQSAGAVAFAKDLIAGGGYAAHQIPHLNDETYGNSNSWIGNSNGTFAGVTFNGPQTIASIAWGRANIGPQVDRAVGPYTVQYTTVPNPDQNTPDSAWTFFQTISYTNDPGFALRHRYDFDPITNVTGIRIAGLAAATAVDEIELYGVHAQVQTLTGSVIQDETPHAWTLPNLGGAIPAEPSPGDGRYHWTSPGEHVWMPLLEGTNVTVESSWGVSFNHSQDVDYFFDPDGAGPLPEIALAQDVSQTLLNDQVTAVPSGQEWSGFFQIGEGLDLSRESVFRVVGNPAGVSPQALSSAVWQFTAVVPEPSTLALAGIAMTGIAITGLGARIRRRKARRG